MKINVLENVFDFFVDFRVGGGVVGVDGVEGVGGCVGHDDF